MKINKYLIGLAVAILGGFTSCNTDVEGEYYTTQLDNISFETKSKSVVVSVDETSVVVPIRITRSNTNNAYSVSYTSVPSANASGIFSDDANGSVSFEAGQGAATINVTASNLEKEVIYADTLILSQTAVESADTITKNQIVKAVVTVQREGDWILIGTGTFTDNYWFEGTGDVEIYANELNPNQFRVKKPWESVILGLGYDPAEELDGNQTPNLTLTIMQPGNTLGDVTITQKDLVYFSSSNTGYFHSSYEADVWIHHPSLFGSLSTEDKWLHNKVLDYKADGTPGRIQLAPYYYMDGVGGWNNTQKDNIVIIDFPGYEPKDFTIEFDYAGILTDPEGNIFATGELELGPDATTVKAAIVDQDADAGAVADAIASGDLEGVDITNGNIMIPMPEGLSGKLLLVIVVLDGDEVKNYAATKFEWYGGAKNPWESLGVGYFVDDLINPLFGYSVAEYGNVYEVEIKESTEIAGLYSIVKMFAPVATDFNQSTANIEDVLVHAENPNAVYIPLQPLGLTIGSNGPFSISTDAGELVEKYGFDAVYAQLPDIFGKLQDGVFTFPILEEESSSGSMIQYQLWAIMDGNHYFGGKSGNFTIVLPSAAASVQKKMKSRAVAASFARRLHGFYGVKNNVIKSNIHVHRVITDNAEQMR